MRKSKSLLHVCIRRVTVTQTFVKTKNRHTVRKLEEVRYFKYLGVIIPAVGSSYEEIRAMNGLAITAWQV